MLELLIEHSLILGAHPHPQIGSNQSRSWIERLGIPPIAILLRLFGHSIHGIISTRVLVFGRRFRQLTQPFVRLGVSIDPVAMLHRKVRWTLRVELLSRWRTAAFGLVLVVVAAWVATRAIDIIVVPMMILILCPAIVVVISPIIISKTRRSTRLFAAAKAPLPAAMTTRPRPRRLV